MHRNSRFVASYNCHKLYATSTIQLIVNAVVAIGRKCLVFVFDCASVSYVLRRRCRVCARLSFMNEQGRHKLPDTKGSLICASLVMIMFCSTTGAVTLPVGRNPYYVCLSASPLCLCSPVIPITQTINYFSINVVITLKHVI